MVHYVGDAKSLGASWTSEYDRISSDRNAGDSPNGELVPSTGRSPAFRSEDIRSYSDVRLAFADVVCGLGRLLAVHGT